MAATAEQIARLRRMIAEPTTATYDDGALADYIEANPVMDGEFRAPDHSDWDPTYDLHAAAADLWEEKAAAIAEAFDFTADGASYSRSQQVAQYMQQARYHRSRRTPSSTTLVKWPKERSRFTWIGNLAEQDD